MRKARAAPFARIALTSTSGLPLCLSFSFQARSPPIYLLLLPAGRPYIVSLPLPLPSPLSILSRQILAMVPSLKALFLLTLVATTSLAAHPALLRLEAETKGAKGEQAKPGQPSPGLWSILGGR